MEHNSATQTVTGAKETRRHEMTSLNFRNFIVYRCTPATSAGPQAWDRSRARLAVGVWTDPHFPEDGHFTSKNDFVHYIEDNPHYRLYTPVTPEATVRAAEKVWLEYIDWRLLMGLQLKDYHFDSRGALRDIFGG